jgi:hypothetical protein
MDPSLRRSLYSLLLVAATGLMVARVANVELLYEPSLYKAYPKRTWPSERPTPSPSFGSNDRARWATVKAIVEDHTFVIGHRVENPDDPKGYTDEGIIFPGSKGYGSVDVALHPTRNEFYATKPPLLTLFVAGQYWIIHNVLKKNLDEDRWETVVPILIVTNVLPLILALFLLSRLLERFGTSDWGRMFVFATACFGTYLTTFVTTLNNHVPASCCVMYAVYALIGFETVPGAIRFFMAGLFSGLAVCLDLPSAAFAGGMGFLVLFSSWRGLIWFVPALLLPIAGQTLVNHQAYGIWEPIYAKEGTEWYTYKGSHWARRFDPPETRPQQIDFLNEPKEKYALNLLVGHHGLFSLTPVWLLSLVGIIFPLGRERFADWLHRLTLPIAAVVIGFYIYKTNNYGGWTSGPRWLFWLTPLFLVALIPAADRVARHVAGRLFAYLCLGVSAFSANYSWANPWRHPWIYQWWEYMGWIEY